MLTMDWKGSQATGFYEASMSIFNNFLLFMVAQLRTQTEVDQFFVVLFGLILYIEVTVSGSSFVSTIGDIQSRI